MNTLNAIIKSDFDCFFSDINFNIKSVKVHIFSNNHDIYIQLVGRIQIEKMKDLFSNIYDLIYLYLGYFPTIGSLYYNTQNIKEHFNAGKYATYKQFRKSENTICDISSSTINSTTLSIIQNYNKLPLNSLQYITCEAYSKVALEHKFTLLVHIIDSLISDKIAKNECVSKWEKISNKSQGQKAGLYCAKILALCEKTFFPFNRKTKYSLLKALRTTKVDFITTISDTRNSFSHLLSRGAKKKAIFDNPELFLSYIDLIVYFIRLYIVSELNVNYDSGNMEKYYAVTYKWITGITKNKRR